ncbi:MAG: alpha/beta hydrolase [Planctomycetes bacterium]|nr:alpha/beta hydrolase [Planctomycetota bacterium]
MQMRSRTAWVLIVVVGVCVHTQAAQTKRKPRDSANAARSRPAPDGLDGAQSEIYKTIGDVDLKLYVFRSESREGGGRRPAIVFFFGGGWKSGSPGQFVPQCRYLASRGMVAISADYRVYDRQQARVVDCVADAQSAVRWIRANAGRLGIDPDRIAAGGGSAGGHLAAATACLEDISSDNAKTVSCRPKALVLFNPPLDLTLEKFKGKDPAERTQGLLARAGTDPVNLSPMDHLRSGLPPTIIFHGKSDSLIPYASIEAFREAMRAAGNRCELVGFDGQGHGFFNLRSPDQSRYFVETMAHADRFLASLGYLKGAPTIGSDFVRRIASRPE